MYRNLVIFIFWFFFLEFYDFFKIIEFVKILKIQRIGEILHEKEKTVWWTNVEKQNCYYHWA
jgi:hypothetical protein